MKKVAVLYRMPNGSPFIRRERVYGTTYKQRPSSGLMSGRKVVKGEGDKTGIRRVNKDFVLVKGSSGKRGYVRKKFSDGMIVGRY